MTARATFESECHRALTKYKQAVAEGTWQVTADNTLVDAILRAADRYALGAEATRQRQQANARALDEALAKIYADASPADVLRAERTDIGRQATYGTKAKAR